jgi:hypothetical protein
MQRRQPLKKVGNRLPLLSRRSTPWARHGLNNTVSGRGFAMHSYGARSAFSHSSARAWTRNVVSDDMQNIDLASSL